MLRVVFKKTDGGTTTIGPLQLLRFDGEEMREVEGGPLLARHEGHSWRVSGELFLRLDCPGPLILRFFGGPGGSSGPYGPFMHFSSVDGIGYADHHVSCQIDVETKRWHLRKDHTEWSTLIVEKK